MYMCVFVCRDGTCGLGQSIQRYIIGLPTLNRFCVYLSSVLCLFMISSCAQRLATNSKLCEHKNTFVYNCNSHISLNERLSWCSGMRNIFCTGSISSLRGSLMWKFFIRWDKAMYSSSSATLRPEKTSKELYSQEKIQSELIHRQSLKVSILSIQYAKYSREFVGIKGLPHGFWL